MVVLVVSLIALISSLFFVGIIPSIAAFVFNILSMKQDKSINNLRALAISFVGIVIPIVMYFKCYGFSLPYEKEEKFGYITQILYDNYSGLGLDLTGFVKAGNNEAQEELAAADVASQNEEAVNEATNDSENSEKSGDMYYVKDGVRVGGNNDEKINHEKPDAETESNAEETEAAEDSSSSEATESIDYPKDKEITKAEPESIFESIDSLDEKNSKGYGKDKKGPSDDDIPSYGGLPIGLTLIGQYFREDDHNCNPVLILKNETGKDSRFECVFTARDEDGNVLALSNKTVESVRKDALFVFEGRFDKKELGDTLPAMYEFLISKKDPYKKDMYDDVVVSGEIEDNSVVVTAVNTSDKKVKVDAYVLFFDDKEMVDCIWMIPVNSGEVCIEPGSAAAIKGDAYYKFSRIETYYTAYESDAPAQR